MVSNRKLGTDFEKEFCEMLASDGYWVHNFAQKIGGQPADVIAVKDKQAYLIDCKVCSDNNFALSRIEDNQLLSMRLWESKRNGNGWFAILINGNVYMVSLENLLKEKDNDKSSIKEYRMKIIGYTLENWLRLWKLK